MAVLRLGPASLLASRFGISPLAETFSELHRLHRALDRGERSAATVRLQRWLSRDQYAAGLIRLSSTTSYIPEFIAIPPSGVGTKIGDELAEMSAVPDPAAYEALVEAQQHSWGRPGIEWSSGGGIAARAAEVFARGWHDFVQPDWTRRKIIMERDIRYRAGILATSGWKDALDGMARKIKWVGHDAIQFSTNASHADQSINADGLILVPHTGPNGQWTCVSPSRTALVYPARGTQAQAASTRSGVARLVGATKSQVLAELRTPATPTQLAAVLGLSLGTVAKHLAAMSDAGVITPDRHGRAVYYELTSAGEELVRLLESE